MTYRLSVERIGDTVLVQAKDTGNDFGLTMSADRAVEFGWALLVAGSSDAPALTPEAVIGKVEF